MGVTPEYEEIAEPVVQAFKDELEETNLFTLIDEGEKVYEGEGTRAMVIPAADNIQSIGMQKLEHTVQIFVIILDSSEDMTLKELRLKYAPAYNRLMQDIRHPNEQGDPTCWVCFPRLWHPGMMVMSNINTMGILSRWEARIHQTYTP